MDFTYEKTFLREMISDFARILAFNAPGYFGELYSEKVWKGSSGMEETVSLTLQGTIAYYYIYIYKEAYPTNPTPAQQANINKLWVEMSHPENVVIL